MPPKKPGISEQARIIFEMRLSLAANRPLDAIDLGRKYLNDQKLSRDLETPLAFLICTSFREALRPLRKCKKPKSAPPATAESVAALQLLIDIATEWLSLCRDGQAACTQMQVLADAKQDKELTVLLRLEAADFKRYEITASNLLGLKNTKDLISEVFEDYKKLNASVDIQGLTDSHYLRLRLCINHGIFLIDTHGDHHAAAKLADEILTKEPFLPDERRLPELAPADLLGCWPVPASETQRLRKKVEDIRDRYSTAIN